MRARHCFVIAAVVLTTAVDAAEIYVDNLTGRDSNDGSLPISRQGDTGPVRTLIRAAQLAGFADTIVLTNTGTPYYGSISLTGNRHSGSRYQPFVIFGNGATISGLRSVPPEGWQRVSGDLWKLTLTRKGYYQLLRDGKLLTEHLTKEGENPLDVLEAGQWVSWKGSLYFRQDGTDTPDTQLFAVTADQTGISMHQVSNVVIADVKLQHFRFDGVHAQGLCDGIELQNVTSVENGRAGVASSGTSHVDLFGCTVERNGRHQILALDRSTASSHPAEPEPEAPQ
jgi:hypothetical protein